jgi:hypothetical protein
MTASPLAVLAAAALLGAVPGGSARAQSADGYVPLFDGTLRGWTVENTSAGNFSILDGALHVDGPPGWLRSERQYADFELLVEFRFLTDNGDSGIFVRAQPNASFGPGWPSNSYQLQLLNPNIESRFPPLGAVFRHGTPAGETTFDVAVARRAFTGVGEWQTLIVAVIGDVLTAELNGVPLTQAANVVNQTGYIGIQGETSALEFRRIDIRER